MSPEEAEQTLDAFLQWFSLIPQANPAEPIQMIETVDRAWHAFVLNTRLYRQFCKQFVGRFVDHDALDPLAEHPRRSYAQRTVRMLREQFGTDVNPLLLDLLAKITCCKGGGVCGGMDDDDDGGVA